MSGRKVYHVYGLNIESEVAMPSLEGARIATPKDIDVEIRRGAVALPAGATAIDEMTIAVAPDVTVLAIDKIGRFRIAAGREILVDQDVSAADDEMLLFLLGTVLGALLYQRDLLPMHCNAVVVNGRAFLFCGDSGAGKSTLAAFLEMRGHRLLTDDVCPLHFGADGISATPGLPRLKLWGDSLTLLGRARDGLVQLPWRVDKYEVPLAREAEVLALPVAAIYHLRDDGEGRQHGIHRLSAMQAVNAITASIYRRRIADVMGLGGHYLSRAVHIVRAAPVFSFNRTWNLSQFENDALLAERHVTAFDQNNRPEDMGLLTL